VLSDPHTVHEALLTQAVEAVRGKGARDRTSWQKGLQRSGERPLCGRARVVGGSRPHRPEDRGLTALMDTLGVARARVAGRQIKEAYRKKLARQSTRKRIPATRGSRGQRFKARAGAYDVLSGRREAEAIDRFGSTTKKERPGPGGQNVKFDFGGFDVGDLGRSVRLGSSGKTGAAQADPKQGRRPGSVGPTRRRGEVHLSFRGLPDGR